MKRITDHDYSAVSSLPRMVMPLAVTGKGIAREGHKVFSGEKHVGYITSGTSVPYKLSSGRGLDGEFESEVKRRSIALALLDSDIGTGSILEIEIRKKRCGAIIVPYHMSSQAPPYVRAILHDQLKVSKPAKKAAETKKQAGTLLTKTIANSNWRQKECINLIPSEMSQSYLARVLSIADPGKQICGAQGTQGIFL